MWQYHYSEFYFFGSNTRKTNWPPCWKTCTKIWIHKPKNWPVQWPTHTHLYCLEIQTNNMNLANVRLYFLHNVVNKKPYFWSWSKHIIIATTSSICNVILKIPFYSNNNDKIQTHILFCWIIRHIYVHQYLTFWGINSKIHTPKIRILTKPVRTF